MRYPSGRRRREDAQRGKYISGYLRYIRKLEHHFCISFVSRMTRAARPDPGDGFRFILDPSAPQTVRGCWRASLRSNRRRQPWRSVSVVPPRLFRRLGPHERCDGIMQLHQLLRPLIIALAQESDHPSYLGNRVSRIFHFDRRWSRSHQFVCAGPQIRGDPSPHLISLANVMIQTGGEPSVVAFGRSATVLAVEVSPPARP